MPGPAKIGSQQPLQAMKTKNAVCGNPSVLKKNVAASLNIATSFTAFLLLLTVLVTSAHAQRGVGDSTGLASRPVKPPIFTVIGKLVEIKTGPCEATTGRSLSGTHLILATSAKDVLNIHLGPAAAVADVVAKLSMGQEIGVRGFRTEKMRANQYVAQSLTFNQTTVELRDANLRPVWSRGSAGSVGPAVVQRGGGRRWRGGR